jgi:hypothetical protein
MLYKTTWLLFIFIFSSTCMVAEETIFSEEKLKELAYSDKWLKLLHYKNRYFGGKKSDADAAAFFLSEDGKFDPLGELKANLEAFGKDIKIGYQKFHPQCAFPLRYKFLKESLKLNYKDEVCEDLNWWVERLNAKSISMIFSSAYPNNPASIYGHTFLKINRKEDGKDIRDFAVDFSAMTDTDSGMIFAVKGLFGGYRGQFAIKPYYVKVNEYIAGESRDLWEYHLNLSEAESHEVVLHLWELAQNSFFDYYFFDENCSYQILTLLEVARPSIDISSLEFFYTLPPETIKRVNQKDFIKDSTYRPSLRKQLLWKRAQLSASQGQSLYDLFDEKKKIEEEKDLYVLDTLSTFLNFRKNEKKSDDREKSLLRNLLIYRASIKEPPPFDETKLIEEMKSEDILYSHGSNRLSLGYGYDSERKSFIDSEFRLGLHALYDHSQGYPRTSNFEYARFKARYEQESSRIYFQDYTFIKIMSLFPILPRDFDRSWSIQFYGERPKDRVHENSINHVFQTTFGLSYSFFNERLITYALTGLHTEIKGGLSKDFRYGPIGKLGFMLNLAQGLNLTTDLKAIFDLNNNYEEDWSLSGENTLALKLSQNTQLRLSFNLHSQTLENLKYSRESKLDFDFFF